LPKGSISNAAVVPQVVEQVGIDRSDSKGCASAAAAGPNFHTLFLAILRLNQNGKISHTLIRWYSSSPEKHQICQQDIIV
jgi:hypothetical protein